jgi:hypothetical protein
MQAKTDEELADIMNDMERCYDIPMLKDRQYNAINKEIIKLYKHIAGMRSL